MQTRLAPALLPAVAPASTASAAGINTSLSRTISGCSLPRAACYPSDAGGAVVAFDCTGEATFAKRFVSCGCRHKRNVMRQFEKNVARFTRRFHDSERADEREHFRVVPGFLDPQQGGFRLRHQPARAQAIARETTFLGANMFYRKDGKQRINPEGEWKT